MTYHVLDENDPFWTEVVDWSLLDADRVFGVPDDSFGFGRASGSVNSISYPRNVEVDANTETFDPAIHQTTERSDLHPSVVQGEAFDHHYVEPYTQSTYSRPHTRDELRLGAPTEEQFPHTGGQPAPDPTTSGGLFHGQISLSASAGQTIQVPGSYIAQQTTLIDHGFIEQDHSPEESSSQSVMQDFVASSSPEFGNQHKETEDLCCSYPNCARKEPFTKKSDLTRHIRAKHTGTKPYMCPVRGCLKGPHRTTFALRNGLLNHIRSTHGDTEITECSKCTSTVLELGMLAVHTIKAGHVSLTYDGFVEQHGNGFATDVAITVVNAILRDLYSCPLCRKRFRNEDFMHHIQSHGHTKLANRRGELNARNLYIVNRGCTHMSTTQLGQQTMQPTCRCATFDIEIRCPVCSVASKDHKAFEIHMLETHLIIREQERAHLEAWKERAESLGFVDGWSLRNQSHDLRTFSPWYHKHAKSQLVQCPSCTWSKTVGHYEDVDHHFSIHSDFKELKTCRREILRLYPGFAFKSCWKPVWDDLVNPVNRLEDASHDDAMEE